MTVKYSEYVSLGVNCEGAFQMRRVLGRDSASFFSWNVTPVASLETLIRGRFNDILKPENLSSSNDFSMILDASHGHKFHSPFSREEKFKEDPDFASKLDEHAQKSKYLIDKFLRPRQDSETTAYFYKSIGNEDPVEFKSTCFRIADLLKEIHGESVFSLIVLQLVERSEAPWDHAHIHNRYLRRYAPWHDATDGHVNSWDKIFREFPHAENMRLAGY
ncbi:MAG TPA: DUF1796 family putative cysteine peptidase [Xanthobacteraceae bacterium]|jgi:hypothetical protein|nr:DUF1796 family putative cysteine peptidase [Xanthobacteraceae bacterium]HQS47153.1 DUF1796 family putative cysteine peptidase [Xanthobacteraceae bacterium]